MLYATEVLHYHAESLLKKTEVVPIKSCLSRSDLSLAYTTVVGSFCVFMVIPFFFQQRRNLK